MDAKSASALVLASFAAFVARDWSASACDVFRAECAPAALAAKIATATYAAATFEERVMTGFVLLPAPTLLALLFVLPGQTRRGIGQALWREARSYVELVYPGVKTIELNSTPCAVPFYRSLGFVPISGEFVRGGCRATRMACWLAAEAGTSSNENAVRRVGAGR